MYLEDIFVICCKLLSNVAQDVTSRMVKGAILLVEKLPDDVSIETVRSAFSDFGEVKWVDINKSAAQVCVVYLFTCLHFWHFCIVYIYNV